MCYSIDINSTMNEVDKAFVKSIAQRVHEHTKMLQDIEKQRRSNTLVDRETAFDQLYYEIKDGIVRHANDSFPDVNYVLDIPQIDYSLRCSHRASLIVKSKC